MTENNKLVWNDAAMVRPMPNIPCFVVSTNGPSVAVFHKLMGQSGDFASITIKGKLTTYRHLPGVSWWIYVPAWPANTSRETHKRLENK